jgi:hypothetical protein
MQGFRLAEREVSLGSCHEPGNIRSSCGLRDAVDARTSRSPMSLTLSGSRARSTADGEPCTFAADAVLVVVGVQPRRERAAAAGAEFDFCNMPPSAKAPSAMAPSVRRRLHWHRLRGAANPR